MDFSCKGAPAKGSEILMNRTASAGQCKDSEVVHANKPLTFGVDRILASDLKKDSRAESEVQYLPQMQFMLPSNAMHFQLDQGINHNNNAILLNKRLIRPQAIRIAENANNGRGPMLRDPVDCPPIYHRLPFPSAGGGAAMFTGPHSHLPILRFNPAMYSMPPKYHMGPHHHQHFLVHQQHFAPQQPSEESQRSDLTQERRPHNQNAGAGQPASKRKRSWSRAVFSNLQRKGLEIAFGGQKYITKPDRRKLAARLGLSDAQVKVWFQNRRMKWRHTGEDRKSGTGSGSTAASGQPINKSIKDQKCSPTSEEMYTSSDEESLCEDEIDVTD